MTSATTAPAAVPLLDPPRSLALAANVVDVVVDTCSALPRALAPVPPGATTLESLTWNACDVVTVCGNERFKVAWANYSGNHLGLSPIHKDPVVGAMFRIRLEQRNEWPRSEGECP